MEMRFEVKSEGQPNDEVYVFYVDDEANTEGLAATLQNLDPEQLQQLAQQGQLQQETYVIGNNINESVAINGTNDQVEEQEEPESYTILDNDEIIPTNEVVSESDSQKDLEVILEQDVNNTEDEGTGISESKEWSDTDIKKLLIFYTDNKKAFVSGQTKKRYLWSVACKTMLLGKTVNTCDMKLRSLKRRYAQIRMNQSKTSNIKWVFYDLCHEAFHDDNFVLSLINSQKETKVAIKETPDEKLHRQISTEGIIIKKVKTPSGAADEKVEKMLQMYMEQKKTSLNPNWKRNIWSHIASQLGEDSEYWYKRFTNFKNHYVRLVDKRKNGDDLQNVMWPYMSYFDEIFKDDEAFQKRYGITLPLVSSNISNTVTQIIETNNLSSVKSEQVVEEIKSSEADLISTGHREWVQTELTVLVKYYFDCFNEFQDPTIPDNFLWNEVGRLLEYTADECKAKYAELKNSHIEKYVAGGYNLAIRIPIEIIFDNIICKEVKLEFAPWVTDIGEPEEQDLSIEEVDMLSQFIYDNFEVFKDPVCYYVCWQVLSVQLNKELLVCKKQWHYLSSLYKKILDEKKDDPEMMIDWRYIDIFERIFNSGTNTKLLDGYELYDELEYRVPKKATVKKRTYNKSSAKDEEEYVPPKRVKTSSGGDPKAFKILEYYLRNKERFESGDARPKDLWKGIAKQVGLTAQQCAHRFRNFKQVFQIYVQREINKPEMPIVWPYYDLCKKVFGYKSLKAKLTAKEDSEEEEEWSAEEIKLLVDYLGEHYDKINADIDDLSKWDQFSEEHGKSSRSCYEKMLKLRKSYRKLKARLNRNPRLNISWVYFHDLDRIYSGEEHLDSSQEIDDSYEVPVSEDQEMEDGETECIIVIPEGKDASDGHIIIQGNNEDRPKLWNKKSKRLLLVHYLNFIRKNKGDEINTKDMYKEIGLKMNRTPLACKKMFIKLKRNHKLVEDEETKKTPIYILMEKILKAKARYDELPQIDGEDQTKIFDDVELDGEKVDKTLQYYLKNIEQFVSPRFEKKYVWSELASFVGEPVTIIYNKLNYLMQNFDLESGLLKNEETPFAGVLQEILKKEAEIKLLFDVKKDIFEASSDPNWTDAETEQLLQWYLENLYKFKSPKFVTGYLWMDASALLKKPPLLCSEKMTNLRAEYRTLVRENPEELKSWKFTELCQKIYGTGKKDANGEQTK